MEDESQKVSPSKGSGFHGFLAGPIEILMEDLILPSSFLQFSLLVTTTHPPQVPDLQRIRGSRSDLSLIHMNLLLNWTDISYLILPFLLFFLLFFFNFFLLRSLQYHVLTSSFSSSSSSWQPPSPASSSMAGILRPSNLRLLGQSLVSHIFLGLARNLVIHNFSPLDFAPPRSAHPLACWPLRLRGPVTL